ncbi:ATP-binding protein [Streptomyces sp. NPDC020965]|uniref:ATP-binding protein n=1 Tax=Streptomyces sp. NPDC020965 TaxID=3365105 RepID=UPI0037ABAADB
MIDIPDPAVVGLAAGTLSAFVMGGGLLRSRRRRAREREENATLRAQLKAARRQVDRASRMFTEEVIHLARERMPAAATRAVHPHFQVPGPLRPGAVNGALDTTLDGVLDTLAAAMVRERRRVDAAACAGMRGATREIQAGLYRLQDVVRSLQHRYDDPELSHTLYALDHENEQSLRRAQVTAVVCGAWVGLARDESHVVDAVVGGSSRLIGYHRVKVSNHLEDGTALISHAVEPVAIIVAELLDNALRHSAAEATVSVALDHAHHGITVTVDDAGVGMGEEERDYAQRMVAGTDPILLSELGDPPRMGLAAIGQLTRQFDLSVDLSSRSPYGGVRGVLMVKSHLLTRLDPAAYPPSPASPRSTLMERAAERQEEPRLPRRAPATPSRTPPPRTPSIRSSRTAPTLPSRTAAVPAPTRTPSLPTRKPTRSAPLPPTLPSSRTGAPPAGPATAGTSPSGTPSPGADARRTPPAKGAPVPARTPVPPTVVSDTITHESASAPDDDALPRRRRRVRPATHPADVQVRPQAPPRRTPEEAAAALGALQAGTAAARNAADPEGNDPDDQPHLPRHR